MAVTQFNPTCSQPRLHSSQLSFLSRGVSRHRHCSFPQLHRAQHATISCSVAPKWVTLLFSECIFSFQLLGSERIFVLFAFSVKCRCQLWKPRIPRASLNAMVSSVLLMIWGLWVYLFLYYVFINFVSVVLIFVHDSVSEWMSFQFPSTDWLFGVLELYLLDVVVVVLGKMCMLIHKLCKMYLGLYIELERGICF